MVDHTRRNLLKAGTLLPLVYASGSLATSVHHAAQGHQVQSAPVPVSFVVQTEQLGRQVDASLAGLSYETLQLADPKLFAADNHELVRLFRELNPHGVLRIGGNTSDSTIWSEYRHRGVLPTPRPRKYGANKPFAFMLQPPALHALAGFLRATGWKLVFGVNLRIGVPAMAAELAQAVQRIVGDQLLAIQIGNEANNYEKDYADFDAAWTPYAQAIRTAGVPIAGPDTGANTDWVIEYAHRQAAANMFLSRHYYRDAAPQGSIAGMLAGDPEFMGEVEQIMRVADQVPLPFRLTEANSYYLGGRDGVSDVFASALWGADFMLAMAQLGVAGINFHGGPSHAVDVSLGRAGVASDVTGADLATRRDAATSCYSPIAGDVALGFEPRPLYYGMQLAQQFARAHMLQGQLNAAGVNLSAYAATRDDTLLVALINKDATRDVMLTLGGLHGWRSGRLMRLHASALDSRHGIVLEGVTGTPQGRAIVIDSLGRCDVALPHGSAVWIRLGHAA